MKAAASFKIEGEIPISSDLQYKFWAKGIDGYDLPKAELSLAQTTAYPVNSTTEAFDSIKFYAGDKIFKFEWFMQRAKEGSLEVKITETKNDMYVCRVDPKGEKLRTLYYNACKWANNKKTEKETFDAIWGGIKKLSTTECYTNSTLYYYGILLDDDNSVDFPILSPNKLTIARFNNVSNSSDLLFYKDGKCGAWRKFMSDCCMLHGIVVQKASFNVKTYGDIVNEEYELWRFRVKPDLNSQGNNANEFVWLDHAFVKYRNKYYDPSYGLEYDSIIFKSNSKSYATKNVVSIDGIFKDKDDRLYYAPLYNRGDVILTDDDGKEYKFEEINDELFFEEIVLDEN